MLCAKKKFSTIVYTLRMKSNYKICFFNTNKAWGGGEKWHLEAGLYLKEKGLDVFYITSKESKLKEKVQEKGLPFTTISISKFSYLNPFKRKKIQKIWKENKIEAVVTNLPQDFKLAGMSAYKFKLKKLIYRRGMPHSIKNKPINKKLFCDVYTDIIANSEEVKKSLLQNTSAWFPKEKISIIYNGVRIDELARGMHLFYPKKVGEVVLGNAARLVDQKGQKHLITLAKLLKEKKFPFKLLIAGTGPLEKELKEMARLQNVDDSLVFLGHVDDIPSFFLSIDYFLFPSHFEGLANTLIEAMAYQKPCFAFEISSMPEIIQDGENGFLCKPFDLDEMAHKIIQLSQDEARLEEIKERAFLSVRKKFDYNTNMQKLLKILS